MMALGTNINKAANKNIKIAIVVVAALPCKVHGPARASKGVSRSGGGRQAAHSLLAAPFR